MDPSPRSLRLPQRDSAAELDRLSVFRKPERIFTNLVLPQQKGHGAKIIRNDIAAVLHPRAIRRPKLRKPMVQCCCWRACCDIAPSLKPTSSGRTSAVVAAVYESVGVRTF